MVRQAVRIMHKKISSRADHRTKELMTGKTMRSSFAAGNRLWSWLHDPARHFRAVMLRPTGGLLTAVLCCTSGCCGGGTNGSQICQSSLPESGDRHRRCHQPQAPTVASMPTPLFRCWVISEERFLLCRIPPHRLLWNGKCYPFDLLLCITIFVAVFWPDFSS